MTEVEENGAIRAGFEFEGDQFGVELDPGDLSIDESFEYAVDGMVTKVCRLVWHELLGTPVFNFDDERFTGRVDVQRPWEKEPRMPTEGWIANAPAPKVAVVEAVEAIADVPAVEVVPESTAGGKVEVSLGMNVDEMDLLSRGVMPESFLARVFGGMPLDRLLAAVASYVYEEDPNEFEGGRLQAARALRELQRRLIPE